MPDAHSRITAGELAIVLSHYPLGVIESLRRFRGGSRQTPKVLVQGKEGAFLLKRRSPQDATPKRVARSHALHARLRASGFPVPELVPSREGKTAVVLEGPGPASGVYELFRFVQGSRYHRAPEQAHAAGALLARLHADARDLGPDEPQAPSGFHRREAMGEAFGALSLRFSGARAAPVCASLLAAYKLAAEQGERLGASDEPVGVLHGDWHPGNVLFGAGDQVGRIIAVFDLDSARTGPLVMDVANGALQFSARRGPGSSQGAPDASRGLRISLSGELLGAFCRGYRTCADPALPTKAWQALPWLMCEALIVEAVVPIAQTGSFGRVDPLEILEGVSRTAASICEQHQRVVELALGP